MSSSASVKLYSRWCPPELTAAAVPLRRTGQLLRALSEDHRDLERLTTSSPRQQVQAAFAEFVERWDLLVWVVGGTAADLGHALARAAQDYAEFDDHLAADLWDREGRRH